LSGSTRYSAKEKAAKAWAFATTLANVANLANIACFRVFLSDVAGMTITDNRIDASALSPRERADLPRLVKLMDASKKPALTSGDETISLPKPVFKFLVDVLRTMSQDRAVIYLADDEEFTTQAAAEFLGMSRQHLVDRLLETNEIPFHLVGTHRRLFFRDLLSYQKIRDGKRREALDNLFDKVHAAGLDDASYTGDATS
jgi:excisionase family DNA binding protein